MPTTTKTRQLKRAQALKEKQLADQAIQNNHQQQMRDKNDKPKMTASLRRIKSIFKERKQQQQQPKKRKMDEQDIEQKDKMF